LAVRISGITQAAAPAVANTDMRPMAWRLETRFSSDLAGDSRFPCGSSLCIVAAISHIRPREGTQFTSESHGLRANGLSGQGIERPPKRRDRGALGTDVPDACHCNGHWNHAQQSVVHEDKNGMMNA
jgi:hypothetical protein